MEAYEICPLYFDASSNLAKVNYAIISVNIFLTKDKEEKDMFVFISYCQHNPEVSGKVSRLAEYLMNEQGIDIQYDKGGLPVSTHIPTFQEKLCSPDCKCVIVVCDKEYLNRSCQMGNTGVAQEYKFIATGVAQKQRTYIPLKYEDCDLPVCFSGDVYLNFGKSGNEREQFIEVFNAIISKNPEIQSTKKNDTLSLIGRYNRAKKETEKKILMLRMWIFAQS